MDLLNPANRAVRRFLTTQGVQSVIRSVGGHQVHYYRVEGTGDGPPVLLAHGLGSSANGFAATLLKLGRRFRSVYALDIPGNGFSPLPNGGPLALRSQMETVVRFIEQVIREPVFLVGNSLGGAICIVLAVEHPHLVKALGLIAPAGARMPQEKLKALLGTFEVKNKKEARAMTRRLFHKPPVTLLLLAGQLQRLYDTPSVRQVVSEVSPHDAITEEQLARLHMPVLLLWGRSDRLLPYESVAYFRSHLPSHAHVHEVTGFGHVPQMERPDQVVRHLVEFAERVAM